MKPGTEMVREALALGKMRLEGSNYASNATYLSGICCLLDVLLLPLTCVMEIKFHVWGGSEIYSCLYLNGGIKRQLNNEDDI